MAGDQSEASSATIAAKVDARGLRCPWPVLRLDRARRDGAAIVDLLTDDAAAASEVGAYAGERGLAVAAIPDGFRVSPR